MADGLTYMASDKTPRTGSTCSDGGCIGFLEIDTGYPRNQHRLFFSISELHKVSCRGRMECTVQKIGSNGGEPPSRLISALYLHGPGLTFFTHATACVPSIWKLFVLPKELRIRHIIHMSFGIILNYYSQGLSPLGLTLSPLFPPSSP